MNYHEKIIAYENTVSFEDLERTYDFITQSPSWHFAYASSREAQEAPNPAILCIKGGEVDSRAPQEVQDYAQAISQIHANALQIWRGASVSGIRELSFQITFEGHHGRIHTDANEEDNCVTGMTFLSPVWFPEWKGEFKYQFDVDTWLSLPYEPGKTILFDSANRHTGVGAAVGSTYARLTCVGVYVVDKP